MKPNIADRAVISGFPTVAPTPRQIVKSNIEVKPVILAWMHRLGVAIDIPFRVTDGNTRDSSPSPQPNAHANASRQRIVR